MNVFEAIHKQDHLNAIVQTLRSGKTIDNDVLANFLQEYYDLLGSLPVGYTEVKTLAAFNKAHKEDHK